MPQQRLAHPRRIAPQSTRFGLGLWIAQPLVPPLVLGTRDRQSFQGTSAILENHSAKASRPPDRSSTYIAGNQISLSRSYRKAVAGYWSLHNKSALRISSHYIMVEHT